MTRGGEKPAAFKQKAALCGFVVALLGLCRAQRGQTPGLGLRKPGFYACCHPWPMHPWPLPSPLSELCKRSGGKAIESWGLCQGLTFCNNMELFFKYRYHWNFFWGDTENPGKVYEYGRALIRFGAGKIVGHLCGVDSYKERHVKKMGVSLNKYLLWDGKSHPHSLCILWAPHVYLWPWGRNSGDTGSAFKDLLGQGCLA